MNDKIVLFSGSSSAHPAGRLRGQSAEEGGERGRRRRDDPVHCLPEGQAPRLRSQDLPKGDRIPAGLRQPEQAVKQQGAKPEGLSLGECQALQEEAEQVSAAAPTGCTRQKAFRKGKTTPGEEQSQTTEEPTEEEQEVEQTLCWSGWVWSSPSSQHILLIEPPPPLASPLHSLCTSPSATSASRLPSLSTNSSSSKTCSTSASWSTTRTPSPRKEPSSYQKP